MWPRRSHTLAPLARITTNERRLKWKKLEQDAFDAINRIAARDTLSTYPEFNENFKIHTNDRKLQLGVVISHKVKPIDLYSIKITDAYKSYTVTEG